MNILTIHMFYTYTKKSPVNTRFTGLINIFILLEIRD